LLFSVKNTYKKPKNFWILLVLILFILPFDGFGEEKVIEEKFSCGPIKIIVIGKIEPVNSTKEILKNTFLMTEQMIIIDNKKIKVGPSLEEYCNKISCNLKNDKDEKVRSLYERYKNYPLYLADVSCYYDNKKNYYVEVGYGIYCNGTHCEYNELYTQDGKLLISDKQRIYLAYTDLNKMNKVIFQYLNFIKKRKLKPLKAQRIYPNFDPWEHLIVENPDRVIEFMTDEDFK
jgi:hypothetical protein